MIIIIIIIIIIVIIIIVIIIISHISFWKILYIVHNKLFRLKIKD